jgi:hypothetical protein
MKECNVLFDSDAPCNFRKGGRLLICEYMNQETGMCMHAKNNKQKRKNNTNNNSFFRRNSSETFLLHIAQKESDYTPDILPYRDAK